jgi:hypothetical protein
MKASKTQSASKLVARFDSQLKKIIMNDLKALKAVKKQLINNISADNLSVA